MIITTTTSTTPFFLKIFFIYLVRSGTSAMGHRRQREEVNTRFKIQETVDDLKT